MAREKASVKIKLFHGSTLDCLDELVALAEMQRMRVLTLYEKERASGHRIVGLNKIISDYRSLLLDLQKVRFDLGLDEFKLGFAPTESAPGTPDRAATEQAVLEAIATLDEILARRRVP